MLYMHEAFNSDKVIKAQLTYSAAIGISMNIPGSEEAGMEKY